MSLHCFSRLTNVKDSRGTGRGLRESYRTLVMLRDSTYATSSPTFFSPRCHIQKEHLTDFSELPAQMRLMTFIESITVENANWSFSYRGRRGGGDSATDLYENDMCTAWC